MDKKEQMATGRLIALIQAYAPAADPETITAAVQDWLDDHPEATTTVEDGSITMEKLASALAAKITGAEDDISDLKNALCVTVDLTNTPNHFYVRSDGVPTNSNNWNAAIVQDLYKVKKIVATLGTNDPSFLGIAFYKDKTASFSNFVSGIATGTNGNTIEADIPSNAVMAVICTRPNSFSNYSAYVMLNVPAIDKDVVQNTAALSSISKYTGHELTISFEQGTIISDSGQETSNTKRIRTGFISVDDFDNMSCDVDHRIWFYEYTKDKQYIKGTVQYDRISLSFSELDSRTGNVRIVITNSDITKDISPSEETGFVCVADTIGELTNTKIQNALLVEKMGSYPKPLFTVDSMPVADELVIIGDKMVGFNTGSDDLTEKGSIRIIKYGNGFDKQATVGMKYLYHYFGHCNTVDFNKENGCLIIGNGSGDYSLHGKIYIIPNFESIIEDATTYDELTLDNTNAIIIDCEEYNLGSKFNVLWGEKNGDTNNIAYLLTATFGKTTADIDAGDIGTIRKLLLGMGDNELQYGQFISGKSSSEFNGTFAILETFTQEGTAYKNCCQGSCFYKGKIVCAIGHGTPEIWEMNVSEGTIRRKEYYQPIYAGDGTIVSTGAAGMCTDGEKIYTGLTNVGVWALNI